MNLFLKKEALAIEPISPMEPKSSTWIPKGSNWIAQIKWDGVRILTYFNGQTVRLWNRKKNERTIHYPELTNIHAYCNAKSVILDGEVVAFGEDGKPSFHEVMKRDGIRRMDRIRWAQRSTPISYMIFDVVYYNGSWIHSWPLRERLELLAKLIQPSSTIQVVESHIDKEELYFVMQQHNMEGIVVKELESPYLIGEKKDVWLKVKNYQDIIAVVGGYTLRDGIVNAVLLGLYNDAGEFVYIGHTGTGKMTYEDWRALTETLKPMTIPHRPFVNRPERQSDAHWVTPKITVKVQYMEWTESISLRQPSIQAFVDKSPTRCTFRGEGM